MVRVGRPPIRVSLHWLLLLLLLRRVLLLLGRLSSLPSLSSSRLLRLMLRMLRVRMRGLAYVSGNVSAVRVRAANRHFHVIVVVGRSRRSGGARGLIGGIVAAGASVRGAAHRPDARTSRTRGYGGGGRGEGGAVAGVGGRGGIVRRRTHRLVVVTSPAVRRRVFVLRNPVANVRTQTGRGSVRLMGRRRLRLMRMLLLLLLLLLLRRGYVGMQRLGVRRVTAVGAVSVRVVMI